MLMTFSLYQVNMERSRQAERERLFLVYAKQWWTEYLQIRPVHKDRLVKIFAQVIILLPKTLYLYGHLVFVLDYQFLWNFTALRCILMSMFNT